jgi:dihydrofolate reductase
VKKLALVVAMSDARVIGKGNALPWHIPEDMKHFRAVTMGHVIVMGRLTHQSIGKALPGRTNVVVTRDPSTVAAGCVPKASLAEALAFAWQSDEEPRVIGGARIYADALPLATKLFVTEVHREVEGDVWFPPLDRSVFREIERRPGETHDVEFVTLERVVTRGLNED